MFTQQGVKRGKYEVKSREPFPTAVHSNLPPPLPFHLPSPLPTPLPPLTSWCWLGGNLNAVARGYKYSRGVGGGGSIDRRATGEYSVTSGGKEGSIGFLLKRQAGFPAKFYFGNFLQYSCQDKNDIFAKFQFRKFLFCLIC